MNKMTELNASLAARLSAHAHGSLKALIAELPSDVTPGAVEGMAMALTDWFRDGLPIAVFRTIDDAAAFAETEPLVLNTSLPVCGGAWAMEIGEAFVFIKAQWPNGPLPGAAPEVRATWDDWQVGRIIAVGDCPFDEAQLHRIAQNAITALREKPDGITVTEHRPSAKAARKRGRKYFPEVEYVIGSTTPLWKRSTEGAASTANDTSELEPKEGWTLSVRTVVRGHWRRQPVGPGHADRKLMWIKPHWRGPADAPVSAHATRIEPAAKEQRAVRMWVPADVSEPIPDGGEFSGV